MADTYTSKNPRLEKRLLDYILQTIDRCDASWQERITGSSGTRLEQVREWRERYRARRSVAQLFQDAKNDPFPRASNIGLGIEQIFGERLIATTLGNTVDLEPSVQATDEATGKPDDAITSALDQYNRLELGVRDLYELSHREVFTVGSVFNKWTWGSLWKQLETPYCVWADPMTKQPVQRMNPQTGAPELYPADAKMPEDQWPVLSDGRRLTPIKLSKMQTKLLREGPQLTVRQIEQIGVPPGANTQDPNEWDFIFDKYSVSAWWFLGREGDPFDGGLQNLPLLWKALGIDPNNLYLKPDGKLIDPIDLVEWHGKFPMTQSGEPIEIIALIAKKQRLLLAWRPSPMPRRPFFNLQVWSRHGSPYGIGIPESLWAIRAAMDAMLNQEIDAGNLYNHPPLLLSSLAVLEDEDYETAGPGTVWTMQDINGAKFLPPPISQKDPTVMLNYLFSMGQRVWGVTDFTLNAPTQSLSPNVTTATGARIVQSEGTVKFGHLTKKLETTRTKEEQLKYDMFGAMLTQPKLVEVNGQVGKVDKSFFREGIKVRAVGDGITTNPAIRQQVDTELYQIFATTQDPFVIGDLENRYELDKRLLADYGMKIDLKTPQAVEQQKLLMEIAQTPEGQAKIKEAVMLIHARQTMQGAGQSNGTPTNGMPPARPPLQPTGAI